MARYAFLSFGKNGVGKGTSIGIITEFWNHCSVPFIHFNMGEILRANQDKFKQYTDNREFVPDDEIMILVSGGMRSASKHTHIFFDGCPRNLGQARVLLNMLNQQGFKIVLFDIRASDQALLARLKKRDRPDDRNPENIQRGIDLYNNETVPALNWLSKKKGLPTHVIDADKSVSEVVEQIQRVLIGQYGFVACDCEIGPRGESRVLVNR